MFGCIEACIAHNTRILGNGILNGSVWHPREENGGPPRSDPLDPEFYTPTRYEGTEKFYVGGTAGIVLDELNQ